MDRRCGVIGCDCTQFVERKRDLIPGKIAKCRTCRHSPKDHVIAGAERNSEKQSAEKKEEKIVEKPEEEKKEEKKDEIEAVIKSVELQMAVVDKDSEEEEEQRKAEEEAKEKEEEGKKKRDELLKDTMNSFTGMDFKKRRQHVKDKKQVTVWPRQKPEEAEGANHQNVLLNLFLECVLVFSSFLVSFSVSYATHSVGLLLVFGLAAIFSPFQPVVLSFMYGSVCGCSAKFSAPVGLVPLVVFVFGRFAVELRREMFGSVDSIEYDSRNSQTKSCLKFCCFAIFGKVSIWIFQLVLGIVYLVFGVLIVGAFLLISTYLLRLFPQLQSNGVHEVVSLVAAGGGALLGWGVRKLRKSK
jgi:hypothetical protein